MDLNYDECIHTDICYVTFKEIERSNNSAINSILLLFRTKTTTV